AAFPRCFMPPFMDRPSRFLSLPAITATASRLEDEIRDWVHLPNDWHVIMKAGRPRTSTVCVAHVEEQRTFNSDRDGRIIEVIRGSGQIRAEKARIGVACRLQTSKARGARRRQARDFHSHVHGRI